MSFPEDGVARFMAALEQVVGVVKERRGSAVWIMFGDQRGARAGAVRGSAWRARGDAEALLNALALALTPVVQGLLAEAKCGCTNPDPVVCGEGAMERLGFSINRGTELGRALIGCRCAICHPSAEGGAA